MEDLGYRPIPYLHSRRIADAQVKRQSTLGFREPTYRLWNLIGFGGWQVVARRFPHRPAELSKLSCILALRASGDQ